MDMITPTQSLIERLASLGDENRLRLLALLDRLEENDGDLPVGP